MKKGFLVLICLMSFSGVANADIVPQCIEKPTTNECQLYLQGLVDGVLMYKASSVGVRLETGSFESRALKYRSGKRYQEANRTYCAQRLPNGETLVAGLTEALASGDIKNLATLDIAVHSMLDCQRLE